MGGPTPEERRQDHERVPRWGATAVRIPRFSSSNVPLPIDAPQESNSLLQAVGEKEDGGSLSLYHDFLVVSTISNDVDEDGIPAVCDN